MFNPDIKNYLPLFIFNINSGKYHTPVFPNQMNVSGIGNFKEYAGKFVLVCGKLVKWISSEEMKSIVGEESVEVYLTSVSKQADKIAMHEMFENIKKEVKDKKTKWDGGTFGCRPIPNVQVEECILQEVIR